MKSAPRLLALLLALAAPGAAVLVPHDAQAEGSAPTWSVDENHTAVSFTVSHLGVSSVPGSFGQVRGTVSYDGQNVQTLQVDVSIDAASVDTRNAKRDEHLRSADFFDVAKYPTIRFKSKRVEGVQAGRFRLVGDLSLHGVTKEVTLDVQGPSAEAKDPWGKTHVGAHASTKILRKDFGVGASTPSLVVGDEVSLAFDVELSK